MESAFLIYKEKFTMKFTLYVQFIMRINLKSSPWMLSYGPLQSSLFRFSCKNSIQHLDRGRYITIITVWANGFMTSIMAQLDWKLGGLGWHFTIGLVAGWIGMTLYNPQDTFPCYDPRASTLFWYLPQVTAKSDPCIDYQVLWSRATWNHQNSSVNDLVLINDLTFWETFGDLNIFMVPWPLSLITVRAADGMVG